MLNRMRGEPSPEGVVPDGVSRGEFLKLAGAAGLLVTCSGSALAVLNGRAQAQVNGTGKYGPAFVEPVIWVGHGDNQTPVTTDEKCIQRDAGDGGGTRFWCKPAAGSVALLPDGRFVYWNALEGTENSAAFINDADRALDDDDSRVLTIYPSPSWLKPKNQEGGVNLDTEPASELLPGLVTSDRTQSNGTMFCSHQCHLPDGSVIVVGGTHYYTEPITVELEGVKLSRIFDPKNNLWFRTQDTNVGRWYPSTIPLETGDVLLVGGVTKLEKPIYGLNPLQPGQPSFLQSFDNERSTETFSIKTGKWTDNGAAAQRSLPLQPRIHMAPNGHIIFNCAGQAFSPNGQSYLESTWSIVAAYDPKTKSWQDIGIGGFPFTLDQNALTGIAGELGLTPGTASGATITNPTDLVTELLKPGTLNGLAIQDPTKLSNAAGIGARLSASEVSLLMKPDQDGKYNKMELLTAGGTIAGVFFTNPGSYLATNLSRIDTVDTSGNQDTYSSRFTGTLNKRRWFSSGTLLPTGEVFACSGADRDEVIFPGIESPIPTAEMFDPKTETWKLDDTSPILRTYHNTALLTPDARVLVGGHAPIPVGYLSHIHLDTGLIGPNDGREPRFEIYTPPYLQGNPERPIIDDPAAKNWSSSTATGQQEQSISGGGGHKNKKPKKHHGHKKHKKKHHGKGGGGGGAQNGPVARTLNLGESFNVNMANAQDLDSVVLMRMSSVTHVNDTEQRGVVLPFTQNGKSLTAKMPSQPGVVPPGYYLLFLVNKQGVPSVGMLVKVPIPK